MNQRINLYRYYPKTKKVPMPLHYFLLAVTGFVGLMLFLMFHQYYQLSRLNQEIDHLEKKQIKYENRLLNFNQRHGHSSLDQEILLLTQHVEDRKKVAHLLSKIKNKKGNHEGFSNYFLALGESVPHDLWLNKIVFHHEKIILEGQTLSSQSVPIFVENLKKEKPFSSENFHHIQVEFKNKNRIQFILKTSSEEGTQ